MRTFTLFLVLLLQACLISFGQENETQLFTSPIPDINTRDYRAINLSADSSWAISYMLKAIDPARTNENTHFQSLKFSAGYSSIPEFNMAVLNHPLSEDKFSFGPLTPHFSVQHEIHFEKIFSMCYSIGYSQRKIYQNDTKIGNFTSSLFLHPKLSLFRRKNIEAYFKLNVGVVYSDINTPELNEYAQNNLISNWKAYTGFTPLGLNLKISDQIWINAEASLWSYETFSVGIRYKFIENLCHPRHEEFVRFETGSENEDQYGYTDY